jgi:hypothetical protein
MDKLMHKIEACLLTGLIFFAAFICGVKASANPTVTFRGGGVTIDLEYPEEAHPNTTIMHDITITATTDLTSLNIGVLIYARVDSTLQLIKNQPISWGALHENQSLPSAEIPILLPEEANGTLRCVINVQTSQSVESLSYSLYTTYVSGLTFSEMQTLYNEMLSNYTQLLSQYNILLADYNSSVGNYTTLLSQYNNLRLQYDSEVAAFNAQLSSNNKLSQDYSTLNTDYKMSLDELTTMQSDFEALNNTKNSLQTSYNSLQTIYNTLNQTHNNLLIELSNLQKTIKASESDVNNSRIFVFVALIAIVGLIIAIIYLKRKQPEPYLVIRKESVTLNPDENENP